MRGSTRVWVLGVFAVLVFFFGYGDQDGRQAGSQIVLECVSCLLLIVGNCDRRLDIHFLSVFSVLPPAADSNSFSASSQSPTTGRSR
ncbi:unnamed protein product, partial [Tilletia laevis]